MTRHLVSVLPVLAAVLLAAPFAAPAQQSAMQSPGLGLHVVDAADAPIAGARVVLGTGAEGVSSESGWVRLAGVQPGRVFVLVTRIGYRPTEFTLEVPATGLEVDVEMEPAPVAVQGVTAVGRKENRALAMGGFYRRKETGTGTFLTREDIARTGAMRTSEVFRRVRGVRVVHAGGNTYKLQSVRYGLSMSQTMGAIPRGGRRNMQVAGSNYVCQMLVFVDGIQQQLDEIDDLQMESVEAIEVYRGSGEVPVEYKVINAACGVVVIWTRSSR
ncbi:MAG TPA: carboxypeptidase-like regulatory domain-containing protein [Longimicrobiaceae bacterium]|nr:carboxypeptidase-like regulatory domain-containing protein [Longimicrobiaceae bacterium]